MLFVCVFLAIWYQVAFKIRIVNKNEKRFILSWSFI